MPLNDKQIRLFCEESGMISPFVERQKQSGVISYGLDSCGYDIRISNEYMIPVSNEIIDVKNPTAISVGYRQVVAGDNRIVIAPYSKVIVSTIETFNMPRNVCAYNHFGKSTYARHGLLTNMTPIDPGYKGKLTFALINPNPNPFVVYANEGIAQLSFHYTDEVESSYADKGGKYMESDSLTTAKVKD